MSNLLIGIIGVALFIGLAMSASIFLGPQFDEAQTNAQASDSVQAVASVASAVSSYRLATGYNQGAALSSAQSLVAGGFLRDVPPNSALSGRRPQIVDASGVDAANSASQAAFSPRYVVMSIGGNEDLCTMVERKVGNIPTSARVGTSARAIEDVSLKQVGCFRTSTAATDVASGDYVVFSRI